MKMKNHEAVRDVRELLFYFQKEYIRLEDDARILSPSEIDSRTLTYLEKVKKLFDTFGNTIDELKKHYMKIIASSIDIKEGKDD